MCMFTRGLMSEDNDSCIEVQLNVTDAKLYASYISNPQCQGKWTKGHNMPELSLPRTILLPLLL